MRRRFGIAIAGVLGVALVVVGGAGAAVPAAPTQGEIAALFESWNDALASGDADRVADRYAPDAVLLPTQSNRVRRTRAGIVDYFEEFLAKRPSGRIRTSTIEVFGPDAAVDSGVYVFTLNADGERESIKARYTFVYELRGGRWLIVSHHSSAMPEPVG